MSFTNIKFDDYENQVDNNDNTGGVNNLQPNQNQKQQNDLISLEKKQKEKINFNINEETKNSKTPPKQNQSMSSIM